MGEMAELFLSSQDDIDFYDDAAMSGYTVPSWTAGLPSMPSVSDLYKVSEPAEVCNPKKADNNERRENMKKFRLLEADEIECKVKKVTPKGLVLLLYKNARTDMDLLDETVGPENWQCDYREIKGNLYCGIGIRQDESKPFVWKWNCGIESREDSEGNQKKGEASDAFKRAGFCWGIGRELYTSPFIFVKAEHCNLNGNKCYDNFSVEKIAYDEAGHIENLAIRNDTKGCRAFLKYVKK